ncbi:DEAD/DEAH box helicase family protein [Bacillus cereus]|uniref:DEAD/DEAH box helicase family protein n=1 Tax=Bacillus cereus TaxID=1396 RepID=UPI000B4B7398|nr:DEAD/DEAH box helicase family protein [Bacillus cereus]
MAVSKGMSFHKQLVLNRWMYRFFKNGSLGTLKDQLVSDHLEGVADDGQTRFFHALRNNLFDESRISMADQLRYDINIVEHWQAITAWRNRQEQVEMQLKYFQYLSLLFTEIYLDWYFNKKDELLKELNVELAIFNKEQKKKNEKFQAYQKDDLNKLAFWNATGSGKTLLLHVNIRQYLRYYKKSYSKEFPDKIILLTPNEGLSRQHIEELSLSGFMCSLFDKQRASLPGTVEVIDINKLGDKTGDKVVAVESFEGRNLVLIDEGHRGTTTADGAWMSRREKLCGDGFAFEYSATFGQVASKGMTVLDAMDEMQKKKAKILFQTRNLKKLDENQLSQLILNSEERRHAQILATREIYAKCIIFDYSYKYFYEDGYGKESLILNLAKDESEDLRHLYFTACLLTFYQQQYLWRTNRQQLEEFNIERPLWVFVGNKVNDDNSDILVVLNFLAFILNNEAQAKIWIKDLIENKVRLLDGKQQNIFEQRFNPLMGKDTALIYEDILRTLFNSSSKRRLKLVNLRGTKGELALRLGDSPPFGLINIGDDSKFFDLCEEQVEFDTEVDDFGSSLFESINKKESSIHLLLGSRKFTEGWSSWRVSTMGLLNMGKGEGSQIIQLFGRGVRLKGKDYSLKRSIPSQRPQGIHLDKLETLNVFGVKADYMAQFKDYLREEGVVPSDEIIELNFSLQSNLSNKGLKSLTLKNGYKENQLKGFKRVYFPDVYEIPQEFVGKIKDPHVILDLYPKLEALSSDNREGTSKGTHVKEEVKIPYEIIRNMDFNRIYLILQEFKLRRKLNNLRISRDKLFDFCISQYKWYTLYMPSSEVKIRKFSDLQKLEDIFVRLLQDYTDRYYKVLKNAYEGNFYQIVSLEDKDPLMLQMYNFMVEDNDNGLEYLQRLKELQALISAKKIGEASKWNANHMLAICFERHLFCPLIYIEDKAAVPLKMRPLAFGAPSEVRFVQDLESFYKSSRGKELLKNRSLYLLRNAATKSEGLGFALAGNFYPDFLLWLVDDETGEQWLSLIDPKGIRNLDLSDPKFKLYKEVKVIQDKLGDSQLKLSAFILSVTDYDDLINIKEGVTTKRLEQQNILFMNDSKYLEKMIIAIQRGL